MIKEIVKAVLAIIIVGGAVYAALTGNTQGVQYLVGIAGIVIGAYFGKEALTSLGKAFKSREKESVLPEEEEPAE